MRIGTVPPSGVIERWQMWAKETREIGRWRMMDEAHLT